ncbi:MAG: diadenylate cyclase, partial [Bryobacterales bacterium]|nr:diadenylate cyclase [Bryobacterales bacterium]
MRWQNIVDFAVLSTALYLLLKWSAQARAMRLSLSIVALFAAANLSRRLDLVITAWVIEASAWIMTGLLLISFQHELRRMVMHIEDRLRGRVRPDAEREASARAIARAVLTLAKTRIGALIVVVGNNSIEELCGGGVGLDARVSEDLLVALFQKDSPLHDGAVVIDQEHIQRAGALLPLSQRTDLPPFYGTRHRAAIGLADRSDARVIVVSEERGEVTCLRQQERFHASAEAAVSGWLSRNTSPERTSLPRQALQMFSTNLHLKFSAIGLAAVVWSLFFFTAGVTLRQLRVPIEFNNVGSGLDVTTQSTNSVE